MPTKTANWDASKGLPRQRVRTKVRTTSTNFIAADNVNAYITKARIVRRINRGFESHPFRQFLVNHWRLVAKKDWNPTRPFRMIANKNLSL
jgi:hypothetical protein